MTLTIKKWLEALVSVHVMKNNLIKIETNLKNVNEHLKTAIDNNLEDIYEDTEAEGGHPIPILLSIAH